MRKELILAGLVATINPERDGVSQAGLDARGASIRLVMITGDYLKTAIAIRNNINILASIGRRKICHETFIELRTPIGPRNFIVEILYRR
jgi:magnesium-transporting ATPase (P-type)